MTVAELIERLQRCNPGVRVQVEDMHGETYPATDFRLLDDGDFCIMADEPEDEEPSAQEEDDT